jgi:hypothetical protein
MFGPMASRRFRPRLKYGADLSSCWLQSLPGQFTVLNALADNGAMP